MFNVHTYHRTQQICISVHFLVVVLFSVFPSSFPIQTKQNSNKNENGRKGMPPLLTHTYFTYVRTKSVQCTLMLNTRKETHTHTHNTRNTSHHTYILQVKWSILLYAFFFCILFGSVFLFCCEYEQSSSNTFSIQIILYIFSPLCLFTPQKKRNEYGKVNVSMNKYGILIIYSYSEYILKCMQTKRDSNTFNTQSRQYEYYFTYESTTFVQTTEKCKMDIQYSLPSE